MSDERDAIRSKLSLVELVRQRVPLKRQGNSWKGLCPFHEDRNPSFQVSDQTGTYRCWSCGAKGDIFTWVMETQKVEFLDALKQLAELAGVELKRGVPGERSKTADWRAAMAEAQKFFREQFASSALASDYCAGRGLSTEIVEKWGIGFAPDGGEALTVHLKKAGFSLAECADLFLVQGDDRNGYSDRFRGRLMFPIRDERGQLIAFGGRVLGESSMAKYINSSDTPLYSKRRVLYAMDLARDAISAKDRAVLVEGYMDVIACHRAGLTETVASLGTAMSEEQAKLLSRWCKSAVVMYDADEAGQKAADRAAQMLDAEGMRVRIAPVPPGEDPDTLLRSSGTDAVCRAAEGGLTPTDYRISRIEAGHTPEQEEFWKLVVEALSEAPTMMEIEKHALRIAAKYPGLNDPAAARRALLKQVVAVRQQKSGSARRKTTKAAVVAMPTSALPKAEQAVLEALFNPVLAPMAWAAIDDSGLFASSAGQRIVAAIAQSVSETMRGHAAEDWLATVEPEAVRYDLSDLGMRRDLVVTPKVLEDAIAKLKRDRETASALALGDEASRDDEALRALSTKLSEIKGA